MRLEKIIEFLTDKSCEIRRQDLLGDGFEVYGIESPSRAKKGYITFLEKDKYIEDIKTTRASIVITRDIHSNFVPDDCMLIINKNPYLIMAYLTHLFAKPLFSSNIESKIGNNTTIKKGVVIGNGSIIGDNVTLMPGVVIGENVEIGSGSIIYPNVCIYNDTKIGNRVIVHANSVIGGDGFGYAHTEFGEHIKIYHNGVTILEDDVEIGSNVSIDRAVFGETIVKKGSKIDNLVQIAHNCIIGEHSIIVAQVGLSGSTTMGRNVVLGGQAGSMGHLHIGDFAQVGAKSAITKNIKPFSKVAGHPLMPLRDWLRVQSAFKKMSNK